MKMNKNSNSNDTSKFFCIILNMLIFSLKYIHFKRMIKGKLVQHILIIYIEMNK